MFGELFIDRAFVVAVICGRTLLAVFVVGVFLALFPVELGSAEWGVRLSGIIADSASLALVGITLLSVVAVVRSIPDDPEASPLIAVQLGRQRIFIVRLLRLSLLGLLLLILWQPVLLQQQAGEINQRGLGQSGSLLLALQSAEKSIRSASSAELNSLWQVFSGSQASGLISPPDSPEGKRRALLSSIDLEIKKNQRAVDAQRRRALLVATLGLVRRLSLYCVYGAGFYALLRFLRSS